ncbi:hypothetical protein GBF38_005904 [Nibea albiflora]|uniref:Uncharacterized protein n=1 Tax=Nibea albiflora TaxID=240163 RepID=A0ACB7FAI4_NIBAL|nr:hypothetical protein GBF38_005904 [Nibea albiflora]
MDTRSYLDEALQCMSILPVNHLDSESESDDSGDNLPNFIADYEELQVAHLINKEKFTDELQVEKHKNRLLLQEMEQLCVSYQLLIARYEDDIQKNHVQSDLEEAIAALQEESEKNKTLRNELDMTTVSLREAENDNNNLHERLKSLCVSYSQFIARYEDDVSKISKKADALQHDLANEIIQKNHLRSDFDEAIAALQEEREKNNALQSHLEKVAMSLKEANLKYKTEVTDVRRQADTLRPDLEGKLEQNILLQTAHEDLQEVQMSQEMKQRDETEVIMVTQQANTMSHEPAEESKSDADLALHNLSAEQEVEEITILPQNAFEEEISERDLDELEPQLSVQSCVSLNLKPSTEREAPQKSPATMTTVTSTCSMNPSRMQSPMKFQREWRPTSRRRSVLHRP